MRITDRVFTHYQNRNEKPGGKGFWHGKFTVFNSGNRPPLSLEWTHGRRSALIGGFTVSLAGDDCDDIQIMLGIPGLFLWFISLNGVYPRSWRKRIEHEYRGRETGLTVSGDHVSFRVWHSEGIYRQAGFYRGLFLSNLFLGRAKYSETEGETSNVQIAMPEGNYPATVRIYTATWKRPRWPRAKSITRAEIEIPGGIPIPGDGENDWDQDDDAVFSLTTMARTVDEAVEKLIANIGRDRGNWKPSPTPETHP